MSFHDDLSRSQMLRDKYLIPLYNSVFDSYSLVDGTDDESMCIQHMGIDTVGRIGDRTVTIEEKIQEVPYVSVFIEEKSCTNSGHESPGWVYTCTADYIFYLLIHTDARLLILNTVNLKDFFLARGKKYPQKMTAQYNHTAGRVIPIVDLPSTVLLLDSLIPK